jgi:hypothetical protein
MANFTLEFGFQITDVNGDTAQVRIQQVVADTQTLAVLKTTSDNINAVLAPLTNGKVTSRTVTVIQDKAQISAGTAPPPADATYPSVTDGARLAFQNANGERRAVTVPAVIEAAFKPNSTTVDPSQTDVAAFIALVEGITDFDGATNLYAGGVKVAHHARRRVTHKSL